MHVTTLKNKSVAIDRYMRTYLTAPNKGYFKRNKKPLNWISATSKNYYDPINHDFTFNIQ